MKIIYFLMLIFSFNLLKGDEITGFWKTINDKTGKAESIIAIYPYQSKYYGRIMATYNTDGQIQDTLESPKERALGVEGNPYYVGLDIIWNLEPDGDKFSHGKILDPEKGRLYDAEVWKKQENLIVRGEVWVFGENQEWVPATDSDFPANFNKPDLKTLVPSIPKKMKPKKED